MKRVIFTITILICAAFWFPTINVQAGNPGCNITSFTLSPSGPVYNLGDVIALEGKSTCGTVRFEIDQEPKSEIGTTGQSMNMNTAEFGAGDHSVCFVAEGEGGWENADRRCVRITVKENQPQCQITSFSYSPRKDVYTLGDEISFNGKSTCGTTRYTVEGKIVSELGSTDLSYQFKTGEWGKETYTVCFVARGEGGWEKAVSKCGTIFVGTDPGLPPVYPDDKEPEPEGGDNCVVKSLSVNPQSANPGDTIQLKGTGDCDGGPRAVKFTVDGQAKGELGAPTLETTWNTSGYSNGTHRVCFLVVKSDWSKAASKCVNVTLGKAAQAPSASCKGDHMALVKDLTIPDGTKVLPGQVFVKSWRIKNDGNCVWNRNYYFTSLGGEKMEGKVNNIPGTVSPGETIDISLELHAPTEPGVYKSYWGIIDPKENQLKNRVFVLIEVVNSIQPGENPGEDEPGEKRSLDILGYCKSRGYTGAYANDKDNARSWVCQRPDDLTFVNYDDACKFTNGDDFGKAVVQNEQNPNSWYCEKITKITTPTPQEIKENNPIELPTKPDDYYYSFGSEPKSSFSYDLSMMRCDKDSQILQDDLAALMESSFWPRLIQQALDNKVSFNICDFIFPDKNFRTVVSVSTDPSLNLFGGKSIYELLKLKINSNRYFQTLNFLNKNKGAAILGHEIQHFIDYGYFDQKYKNYSKNERCELLQTMVQESFMFEVRGYAIEDAIYRDVNKDSMSTNEYKEIMENKKIEQNYKDLIMDFYNNQLQTCQSEGFLLNKSFYINYDAETGLETVELR